MYRIITEIFESMQGVRYEVLTIILILKCILKCIIIHLCAFDCCYI